jgi:hypothetical protein
MSEDLFNAPATASGVKVTEFEGRLLLITPTAHEQDVETSFGAKDAVRANLVVIDEKNPTGSEKHDNVLLFQSVLIGQTKPFVGKGMVLGRLGKGEAKKGQSAPWRLEDADDSEKDIARAYLTSTSPDL